MIGSARKSPAETSCPHRPHAVIHQLIVGRVAAAAKKTDMTKLAADLRGFLDGVSLAVIGLVTPGRQTSVSFTIVSRELDQ